MDIFSNEDPFTGRRAKTKEWLRGEDRARPVIFDLDHCENRSGIWMSLKREGGPIVEMEIERFCLPVRNDGISVRGKSDTRSLNLKLEIALSLLF